MVKYVPPKLCNSVALQLIGITGDNPGHRILPYRGSGQTIAIADSGLDQQHPDFAGRLVGVIGLWRPGETSDPHGHGTHVAGSALGDGTASNGEIQGVAPEAHLYFQAITDNYGRLVLPLSLADGLFEPAYAAGARIHNDSWGAETASTYNGNCDDVDTFVARRRDMLIVIAAGNAGNEAGRVHSQPGYVDWESIDSPGACKNALTVGASRSTRTIGGYSQKLYGQVWREKFLTPPIAIERVSGDKEAIAAFSSRGPCDDQRIKPDVVAPGTDILSTRSNLAPSRNFWGDYPPNMRYAYHGGTSMAAPLVSGCAALVREYYMRTRDFTPSAALLKATLINGTRPLTAPDSVARERQYHQGFGAIYMPCTIPNSSVPNLVLEFEDPWQNPALQFRAVGDYARFLIEAGSRLPLRICLAYTDLPSRSLQNDLSIIVKDPAQVKHMGNAAFQPRLLKSDTTNNVEIVRLMSPQAGTYVIQVFARSLREPPQDYALVVSGDLKGSLTRLPD
nr:S8 family serine peptidase [Streptomyces viridochromogenes]